MAPVGDVRLNVKLAQQLGPEASMRAQRRFGPAADPFPPGYTGPRPPQPAYGPAGGLAAPIRAPSASQVTGSAPFTGYPPPPPAAAVSATAAAAAPAAGQSYPGFPAAPPGAPAPTVVAGAPPPAFVHGVYPPPGAPAGPGYAAGAPAPYALPPGAPGSLPPPAGYPGAPQPPVSVLVSYSGHVRSREAAGLGDASAAPGAAPADPSGYAYAAGGGGVPPPLKRSRFDDGAAVTATTAAVAGAPAAAASGPIARIFVVDASPQLR